MFVYTGVVVSITSALIFARKQFRMSLPGLLLINPPTNQGGLLGPSFQYFCTLSICLLFVKFSS